VGLAHDAIGRVIEQPDYSCHLDKFIWSNYLQTDEFDRRFDDCEDLYDFINLTKAKIIRHEKKMRITLEVI
jgi:hypothetical protein